ncbi:hypothetical protein P3W45_001699 [Vairimorpha bombi]
MDVEHEFKWEICNPRKPRHCEYLSPFKRKRVDIDCTDIVKYMPQATNNYKINMCDKSTRVPAMNKMCSEWECVIENGNIKYTSVLFEVMGDVCNGFIDRVSWKSILVLSVFFIIYLKFRRGGSK